MIGELTNHLWQSTIFAIAAGLLAIAFRKNRAQVRFWLWFSASIKFLMPFSLLMSLGSHVHWAPSAGKLATQVATPAGSVTIVQIAEPFSDTLPIAATTTGAHDWIPLVILVAWVLGFVSLLLFRFRAWLQVRAALRSSTAMDTTAAVEVRSSPGLLEPGVVGLLHPILLLPEGIVERLTAPQLAAVLAHELCHIRRGDNLFASIHMIIEAVFWFHPLIWWIGARLVEERERACDEDVLRMGNDAQVYAEGILNICKLYVESPLVCVSGVTGADLKKRIEDIMTERVVLRLTFARKAALAAAGMVALAVPIVVGIMNVPYGRAQSAASPTPKFEVASIKPCKAGDIPSGRKSAKGGGRSASPGSLDLNCVTVNDLIQGAYGVFATGKQKLWVRPFPVEGAAGWINSERYSIDAKTESPQGRAMMMGPLMRALLEDRFKLKVRSETRDVPVYVLTVAKGGPKNLQAAKEGGCVELDFDHPPAPPGRGERLPFFCGLFGRRGDAIDLHGTTMANLSEQFSALLDREVIDKTGIEGLFDIHLNLSPDDLAPGTGDPPPPGTPGDETELIFAAVRKLGMKLEAAKGPGKFLVIDHVERPTEN